ncbi:hypothetical protein SAMN05216470_0125 [Streptococcus equinus]|uniref:Uncharacterized protein n=1 Tax=Streptococcus equinus TaxID=1335 RepID=A0A239R566_STREI|nr:hypothetical protein [Streptococcus equinus]SNU06023.1 hypothetical protein SAMN05216470_0125 [Streptococcus equinus]
MVTKVECPRCGGTNWEIIGPNLQCSYCSYIKGIKEQAQENLSSKDAANLLVQKNSHRFTLIVILISLSILAFITYKIVELVKVMIANTEYFDIFELFLPMLFIGLPIIIFVIAPVIMTIVDTISTIIQKNNGVDVEAIAESKKEIERIRAQENIVRMKSLSDCSDEDFIAEGKRRGFKVKGKQTNVHKVNGVSDFNNEFFNDFFNND